MSLGACWDHNAAYTWMGWIQQVTDTNSSAAPFSTAASATNYEGDAARTTAGGTNIRAYTVIAGTFNGSGAGTEVGSGAWFHVALVRTGAAALQIYVDGSLVSTETTSVASRAAASNAFLTLVSATDASPHNNPWAGRVGYMKVWTAALDSTEIGIEKTYGVPVRKSNLWDWWTLSGGNYNGQFAGNNWTVAGTITDAADPTVSIDSFVSWTGKTKRYRNNTLLRM